MRRDKRENRFKQEGTKLKKFTRVWSILYLILMVAFAAVLVYMNLLPLKLLAAVGVGLLIITLLIFPAMFSPRFKKSRRILCLVISIIMMIVYGVGIAYMAGTIDFMGTISKLGQETEDYHVIVKKDSPYTEIDQINGKTVQTYLTNDINYSDAKAQLKDKEGVEYEMIEDLSSLSEGMTRGDYEIIFISAAQYKSICDEHQDFEEGTKILYTVKVVIESSDISKNVDVTKEPFNMYISGLDVEGTIDVTSRSDVNMLLTVNPVTHKILLTSIPRDYLIKLKGKGDATDKLTHTGLYGIEETISSVEDLLGIDINYYTKVNYTTVKTFVDAIGGIDVDSDYTFTTSGMAKEGLSGITFYEGENHLDGSRALAFARERHSFADGDNQRVKNQQKIVKAIIKKGTSSTTILTKYSSILNSIEDYIKINMSQKEMQSLIKMQLDSMPGWDIETQDLEGVGITGQVVYSLGEAWPCWAMGPNDESIIKCVDKIVETMETSTQEDSAA